jgi:hypothetical protein
MQVSLSNWMALPRTSFSFCVEWSIYVIWLSQGSVARSSSQISMKWFIKLELFAVGKASSLLDQHYYRLCKIKHLLNSHETSGFEDFFEYNLSKSLVVFL